MTVNTDRLPLVSVIISTYNYGHLIGETLQSLQRQTYSNWECIVIDDGSADQTGETMQGIVQADSRIKYFPQENKGMSAARNRGISMATGDFIQLLDADDLLAPEKFEKQVAYLLQHPEADLVYGGIKYFYSDTPHIYYKNVNGTQQEWMPFVSGSGDEILSKLIVGNIMGINCPLIRKGVFTSKGAFKENMRHNEDWEMFLRWALKGTSFYYLPAENTEALVRMHHTSASRDKWSMRFHELELKESMEVQTAIPAEVLAYELDKLRLSLLFIALSTLSRGQAKKASQQLNVFIKKRGLKAFRRNGVSIILEKFKAIASR